MTSDFCDLCEIPEFPVDPLTIWENIPCPPTEFEEDLFSTNLLNKLGPEKGMAIILSIARRCNINVPKMFPSMGHVSGTFIFDTCGPDCLSVTIGVCLSVLLVMILVALAGFARREWGWFQPTHDRYVIDHISTMMSEDGTASEYKYTKSNDTSSKLDDEISSTYVARWYKIFVSESCSENNHSIYNQSTNSHCICKRLAEHIYEDIDSIEKENENTKTLLKTQSKHCSSNGNLVLKTSQRDSCKSEKEICDEKNANDYQTLKLSGNEQNTKEEGSRNNSCLNESPSSTLEKSTVDNECDVLLSDEILDRNFYERLNSNTSAHSGTPLLLDDSTDSDSLTAIT